MNILKKLNSKYMDISFINRMVRKDAKGFVEQTEYKYKQEVKNTARLIADFYTDCRFIMLCGASSSGKTTTANMLKAEFDRIGKGAVIISLDDFYKGIDDVPLLPNGEKDCECVEALEINDIKECLKNLLLYGEGEKPIFDFIIHQPSDEREQIKIKDGQIVIVEGIHALNPIFTSEIPTENTKRVYIETNRNLGVGLKTVFKEQDLRLLRRLARDKRFRAADANLTMNMWVNVCDGELYNIRPYRKTVSFRIDSFHAYEPCLFKEEITEALNEKLIDEDKKEKAKKIREKLSFFTPIDSRLVPKDSLLREFIGGGLYNS